MKLEQILELSSGDLLDRLLIVHQQQVACRIKAIKSKVSSDWAAFYGASNEVQAIRQILAMRLDVDLKAQAEKRAAAQWFAKQRRKFACQTCGVRGMKGKAVHFYDQDGSEPLIEMINSGMAVEQLKSVFDCCRPMCKGCKRKDR